MPANSHRRTAVYNPVRQFFLRYRCAILRADATQNSSAKGKLPIFAKNALRQNL